MTTAVTVVRRDGRTAEFDATRIEVAIRKAFIAVEGEQEAGSQRVRDLVGDLTTQVGTTLEGRRRSAHVGTSRTRSSWR